MAYVRVEQRNARLAAAVRVETVQGKEGPLSKGTVVVISNVRKGSGEGREEEATSIQWTLWGKQADNAAAYLGKGSRVNVLGRLQNNNYQNADGQQVYGMTFTVEDIDYLDTKADADARKAREVGNTPPEASGVAPVKGSGRTRAGARTARAMATTADEDVPF